MGRIFRDHGLTVVLLILFVGSVAGMVASGFAQHNQELAEHGGSALTLYAYLASGDFQSALFENWESEFLQMAAYVVLTAMLFQRGSAESRDPDDPGRADDEETPGFAGWIYARSLGLTLTVLFLASFVLHWRGSLLAANARATLHGSEQVTAIEHLLGSQFWFESFQNWQSEFLATALLVVLSIVLRHRDSPESKPVQSPHSSTGA